MEHEPCRCEPHLSGSIFQWANLSLITFCSRHWFTCNRHKKKPSRVFQWTDKMYRVLHSPSTTICHWDFFFFKKRKKNLWKKRRHFIFELHSKLPTTWFWRKRSWLRSEQSTLKWVGYFWCFSLVCLYIKIWS